jgi:hypothetical protein
MRLHKRRSSWLPLGCGSGGRVDGSLVALAIQNCQGTKIAGANNTTEGETEKQQNMRGKHHKQIRIKMSLSAPLVEYSALRAVFSWNGRQGPGACARKLVYRRLWARSSSSLRILNLLRFPSALPLASSSISCPSLTHTEL